jgi:hypothetical protein
MNIELLWWEGCPSHPSALEELRAVMQEEGADPDSIQLREVTSDEEAARERFFGSPTIRIDGEDVQEPPEGTPVALTCRVYRLRDGSPSPTPDPEDLRQLIKDRSN